MLRLLALLLLLANAGYYAWSQGHLMALGWGPVEQREPQRLNQQLAADQLKVLSAPNTGAAATVPPATVTPANPDTPTPAPGAAGAPEASAEPATCQQVAGLNNAQADTLEAGLRSGGFDPARWRREESVLPERWIVYVGKFPSADLLNRKKTELRSLKVEFRDVSAPALQPGLALGTYSTEAAAQTALQDLGRVGVRSARVTKERDEQRLYTLRLPVLSADERTRVAPLVEALPGRSLAACP